MGPAGWPAGRLAGWLAGLVLARWLDLLCSVGRFKGKSLGGLGWRALNPCWAQVDCTRHRNSTCPNARGEWIAQWTTPAATALLNHCYYDSMCSHGLVTVCVSDCMCSSAGGRHSPRHRPGLQSGQRVRAECQRGPAQRGRAGGGRRGVRGGAARRRVGRGQVGARPGGAFLSCFVQILWRACDLGCAAAAWAWAGGRADAVPGRLLVWHTLGAAQ